MLLKKINIYINLIIFALLCFSCNNYEETNNNIIDKEDKIGIIINKNSSVRIQPFIYSAKIGQLNRNSKVKIIARSNEKSRIGKSKKYWFKIELKEGIYGWTFGSNVKIFSKNDSSSIKKLEKELLESDKRKIIAALKGKWWSINRRGEFTNHSLSFWKNKNYLSSKKNGNKIEGSFEIDANDSKIILSNSSTVGKKINFFERGREIGIQYSSEKYTIAFKKISSNPEETINE